MDNIRVKSFQYLSDKFEDKSDSQETLYDTDRPFIYAES